MSDLSPVIFISANDLLTGPRGVAAFTLPLGRGRAGVGTGPLRGCGRHFSRGLVSLSRLTFYYFLSNIGLPTDSQAHTTMRER